MPMRSFIAPDGEHWRVWRVVPDHSPSERGGIRARAAGLFSPGMETGWLCFESESAKRRLTPPPADWDTCAEDRLVRHWYRATPARPFGGLRPG